MAFAIVPVIEEAATDEETLRNDVALAFSEALMRCSREFCSTEMRSST